MTFIVTDTTDKKYVGAILVDLNKPLVMSDQNFHYDKKIDLGGGSFRLYNSNYVIDVQENTHG